MAYDFQGISYRCEADLLAAVAEAFMTCGGGRTRADQIADPILASQSSADLARECVREWALDQASLFEDDHASCLDDWQVTEAQIAAAIQAWRDAPADQ